MEIERKFLIKKLPDISGITPIRYERYFLKNEDGIEERVQKKGNKYEYESKRLISELERTRDKKEISEEEFEKLKLKGGEAIIRDGYALDDRVSIKIYHGRFAGLKRAEIEFGTVEEAKEYQPESWMGKEITATPLAKDSTLLRLSPAEFQSILEKENGGM